ncbi:MAG: hypothetical protein M5R40_28930 [Anaerolineae bacterium]|nr:hypothetical protein [Anaerolineae bacterium]
MSHVEGTTQEEVMYCAVHPQIEATLRCNRCNRPMCIRCAVRTPVGYRCRECVRLQQNIYFSASARDYVIGGVAAFLVSAVAGGILLRMGFLLLTILLSAPAGGLVSEVVWRAVGRRRGRYLWIVVAAATALGAAPVALWWYTQVGAVPNLLETIIYIALAGSTAAARFRFGLRLG